MLWLIGLTVFGLAVASGGVDSGQSDDEPEVDEEEPWIINHDGEKEERQENSESTEYTDEIEAESGDRQIAEGTSGKDLIFSYDGGDGQFSEIYGNDGNDRIYAGDGAEVFGGAGNDMIILRNQSEDSLPVEVCGENGSDAFLFEGSNLSPATQGVNIISDYHPGEDVVGVILEDEYFDNKGVDGSVSYSLKGISAEVNEDGTLLTISISRDLDPNCLTEGDESSTNLTHQILLKGVTDFDPKDFVIINDWIAFGKEYLGSEGYSSVISPAKQ